jgi:putative ABC transport system permease protein
MDIFRCALKSLLRKRLRTILTAGSITIGVMMVVIVTIISSAGKHAVNNELQSLGLAGLSITTTASITNEGHTGISSESLEIIRSTRNVSTAMPLLIQFASSLIRETRSDTIVCGIDAGAVQAISLNVKHGRMITKGDVLSVDNVCVIDETLAKSAYGRENITGKTIYLQIFGTDYEFEIVGIAKAGSTLLSNLGEFIPGMVYIPYSTLQTLTGRVNFDQVAVRVANQDDISETESQIIKRLEHSTGYYNYFRAENLSLHRDRLGSLLDIVSLILTALSAISMVVSGLGIMTIMLVSVNERMREIGIKKSIGASRKRIMLEFLTESVIISLIGSLSGILIGSLISAIGLGIFGQNMFFNLNDMAIIVFISILIGAIFGVYPAIKASRLRPVDALRME